jgi:hypothetical protein
VGLVRRIQARLARSRHEIVSGRDIAEPILIDRLICPLRYDLCVRIEFIRLLHHEWTLYQNDLAGFLDRPQSKSYYIWFKEVACARYKPQIYRDEKLVGAAFVRRVHETARLWKSIDQHGYDSATPIRLRSGRSIRRVNAKTINSAYFAGDGCHRISCLYVAGRTRLEPEEYEVEIQQDYQPLDNTSVLIQQLPLERTSYLRFISRFYCGRVELDTDAIRREVASTKPHLLSELDSVLVADLPSFSIL